MEKTYYSVTNEVALILKKDYDCIEVIDFYNSGNKTLFCLSDIIKIEFIAPKYVRGGIYLTLRDNVKIEFIAHNELYNDLKLCWQMIK